MFYLLKSHVVAANFREHSFQYSVSKHGFWRKC